MIQRSDYIRCQPCLSHTEVREDQVEPGTAGGISGTQVRAGNSRLDQRIPRQVEDFMFQPGEVIQVHQSSTQKDSEF